MIKTTTDSVEGRPIKEYLGIVSGTDIYLVGGVFGGGLSNQENLYNNATKKAMSLLEAKAAKKGANAIVGISVNVTSPGNANNIIVVITGTAVRIKDLDDTEEDALPEL
ncbi:MAG: hypothetical protein EGR36_06510 [Eubacterium ventriosum]|uniref:heavy metal-binding domain-containing protein n=1 Tax=Eubacterium ventriosum TaxID=39496 RepID=UPI001D41740D|nr:heavy metal-binding domain-containing protein [Eubacterium ventriosum]MBD9055643.1 hypothetical protein [Eubacterium ventriosum]